MQRVVVFLFCIPLIRYGIVELEKPSAARAFLRADLGFQLLKFSFEFVLHRVTDFLRRLVTAVFAVTLEHEWQLSTAENVGGTTC